jgi:two-component system NarL family response regulator
LKNTTEKSKVLLVDDHPVVLAGLHSFLASLADLQVVAAVRRGGDAVRKGRDLQPDLVLLDMSLPDTSPQQMVRLLRAACPRCRVVAFAADLDVREAQQVMQAGAVAYVTKDVPRDALIGALRAAARGEKHFPQLREIADTEPPSSGEQLSGVLSRRELQVLVAIAEGKTNKQIADRLGISVRTVETHRENLTRKVGVQGTAALTKWAITRGLVDPRK